MGLLSAAGMVSGAGLGAEKGLDTVQKTFTLDMLQRERANAEMERTKFIEGMATQRQGAADKAAMDRLNKSEAGATERQNKSLAAHEANVGQQISSHESMANLDRESRERMAREEIQANQDKQNTLFEHDRAKQQADMAKDIILHTQKLQGASEVKLDPAVKAQVEFQMDKLKGVQKRMEGGLLPPADLAAAQQEIDAIGTTIDRLVGRAPETLKPKIIDPFAAKLLAPRASAGHAPINGPSSPVEPSGMIPAVRSNVIREGKQKLAQAKAALDAARTNPNIAPSGLQQLQATYDTLNARWGTGKE